MLISLLTPALAQGGPGTYLFNPPSLYATISTTSPTCDPANNPPAGTPCAPSLVYVPGGGDEPVESLFLYLPGSGNEPEDHDLVLKTAAFGGYRTLGLAYDNRDTVGSTCEDAAATAAAGTRVPLPCSDDCPGLVREERLLGLDTSTYDDVDWHDAIVPRLWETLDQLHTADPTYGWDAYYNPNKAHPRPRPADIYWEDIVVAGFSQGAGHALMIAQNEQVDGVVLNDGGSDSCIDDTTGLEVAASWYANDGGASDAEPHYASYHERNGAFYVPPAHAQIGFTQGDNVDTAGWTLGDWEIFTTNQTYPATASGVSGGCTEHKSMARDGCMPKASSPGPGSTTSALLPMGMHLYQPYLQAFIAAGQ